MAREAEQPLLQERVLSIPQREREAEPAFAIRDPEKPILAPAIRPAPRLIVRKIFPRGAELRIILAHRRPLSFAQVRPPALPVLLPARVFRQALLLGIGCVHSERHSIFRGHSRSRPRFGVRQSTGAFERSRDSISDRIKIISSPSQV